MKCIFRMRSLAGALALGLAMCSPLVMAETDSLLSSGPAGMICGTGALRPDAQDDLTEQILQIPAGGRIAYYRFGQGSPVVLVTGYRASLSEWNTWFLRELATQHEVIIFDNRGVGRSVPSGKTTGIASLAEDTARLIRGLKLQNVTLLGWSMGGMVAQAVAERTPDLVRRLVLMNTMAPGPQGIPTPPAVLQVLSATGPDSFGPIMDLLFPPVSAARAEHCFVKDMFLPKSYAQPMVSESVALAQERVMAQWHADSQAADRLADIHLPTLLLAGGEDQVLSADNAGVIAKRMPLAEIRHVPSGGHAMMYQYPLALGKVVNQFIAR